MKKPKTAIVTGSGHGIGRAIALAFAENNYVVIIAEKDETSGKETQDFIRSAGGSALFIKTDVCVTAEITAMVNRVADEQGTIDVLVNNAGVSRFASLESIPEKEWDLIIDTNLKGAFWCARAATQFMKKHGGSIINIASTRALMSEPDSEAYAASKGGLISLTHALAASLSPYKIRVNCISPGWIETGDYDKLRPEDHGQHFAKRVGRPSDITEACLFLVSEKSGFITGANLIIDGGMSRKMIYEP